MSIRSEPTGIPCQGGATDSAMNSGGWSLYTQETETLDLNSDKRSGPRVLRGWDSAKIFTAWSQTSSTKWISPLLLSSSRNADAISLASLTGYSASLAVSKDHSPVCDGWIFHAACLWLPMHRWRSLGALKFAGIAVAFLCSEPHSHASMTWKWNFETSPLKKGVSHMREFAGFSMVNRTEKSLHSFASLEENS